MAAVCRGLTAITAIRTPVAVCPTDITVCSKGGLLRLRMVADAMGPGVVRVERNATGGTTLDRNEQSVIAGVAFSGYPGDITIIFSVLRICQIEPPALVIIRCCGTCRIWHSGDGARTQSHENSRIHLFEGPHMRRFGSQVARRYKPVITDLSLEAEIPLRHFHVLDVVVHRCDGGEKGPGYISRHIFSRRHWKRISAWRVSPWIFEIHITGQCISGIPWRGGTQADEVMRVRKVVKRPTGSPQRRAAVPSHIPCESHAR